MCIRDRVYTPHIHVVDLIIEGKKVNAILKDIQFHPVKDTILHVDFHQIDEAKPIVMEVPVQLEGIAEGVKAGGKLALQKMRIRDSMKPLQLYPMPYAAAAQDCRIPSVRLVPSSSWAQMCIRDRV